MEYRKVTESNGRERIQSEAHSKETEDRAMTTNDRDRVISISLTEGEWRAFVARQPRPVDWLRARILEEVARDEPAESLEGIVSGDAALGT
jgi:hypothetical protein